MSPEVEVAARHPLLLLRLQLLVAWLLHKLAVRLALQPLLAGDVVAEVDVEGLLVEQLRQRPLRLPEAVVEAAVGL
jgi:hypothetical protein